MNAEEQGLIGKLRGEIARAEADKGQIDNSRADAESRRYGLDCEINSAQRQIDALDAYASGQKHWPDEGQS